MCTQTNLLYYIIFSMYFSWSDFSVCMNNQDWLHVKMTYNYVDAVSHYGYFDCGRYIFPSESFELLRLLRPTFCFFMMCELLYQDLFDKVDGGNQSMWRWLCPDTYLNYVGDKSFDISMFCSQIISHHQMKCECHVCLSLQGHVLRFFRFLKQFDLASVTISIEPIVSYEELP